MTLETPRVLNKCNHQLSFLYPLNSQTIVDYVCSKTQHFHICFENSFQSTCGYCHRLKYIIPITGDIHIIITQFMFSFAKSWSKKGSLISVSLVTWTSSNVIYWAKATEIKAVIWSTLYLKSLPKRKTHHCGGKKKKKKNSNWENVTSMLIHNPISRKWRAHLILFRCVYGPSFERQGSLLKCLIGSIICGGPPAGWMMATLCRA